jgi:hypothetical protein
MSFQPPPPPAGSPPPQGPPNWGSEPPSGGLGYGPPSSATSGRPAKAKQAKMVAPLAIVAALVLIGVAVLVVVLSSGGDSKLDGKGAAAGFAALAADADYTDGFSDLRRCPLGEQTELTDDIADLVDASDELLDGTTDQYMIERTGKFPESLLCTQLIEDPTDVRGPTGASYYAGDLPSGDYESFLEDDAFTDVEVTLEDTSGFKGGTIYPYCTEPDDADTTTPVCGADWVDDDNEIVVGLYLGGDRASSDDAVAALEVLLPKMVPALADQAS